MAGNLSFNLGFPPDLFVEVLQIDATFSFTHLIKWYNLYFRKAFLYLLCSKTL